MSIIEKAVNKLESKSAESSAEPELPAVSTRRSGDWRCDQSSGHQDVVSPIRSLAPGALAAAIHAWRHPVTATHHCTQHRSDLLAATVVRAGDS